MRISLSGKTAIITGCSRGIGVAIARRFARDGANLVITARSQDRLCEVANSLRASGAREVSYLAGDITDPSLRARLHAQAKAFGGADVLVNNAGIFPAAPLAETTPELVEQVMGCNVFGLVAMCREFVPAMAQRTGASVINISSVGARVPLPGMSLYAASKAAVEAFSRSIAAEFAPHVRVNCISPGPILTESAMDMVAGDSTGATDTVTQGIPLQRYGKPEEVAEAAYFLATQASGWTTGEVLQVNGGGLMA